MATHGVPTAPLADRCERGATDTVSVTLRSYHARVARRSLPTSPRMGRLMEDLDALAGTIAYRHCDDGNAHTRPLTIVTASVDRIWLLSELRTDYNLRMRGHVSWVGTSSMEVCIQAEARSVEAAATDDVWQPVIAAAFTMVARDPATNRSGRASRASGWRARAVRAPVVLTQRGGLRARPSPRNSAAAVNKLELTTDLERAIFARGAAHSAAIKEAKRQSLDLTPPTRAGTVTAPPAPRWSQHVRGLLFMIGRGALSPCPRPRSLSSGGAA